MDKHETFIKAIHEKKKVRAKINSDEKGVIVRNCIPFDFGPSNKYKDKRNRYHFWDIDSPDKPHTLSILPDQLVEIEILDESFNPGDYVTWSKDEINWYTKRDWGEFS